jgi:L-ascorbate metabolism protein UlaG (beta-lactamase superfamily)
VTQLTEAGASDERVHEASAGTEFSAAGFSVRAMGSEHAVIHPKLPPAANIGYLIEETALHPGDSFVTAPEGVTVHTLFLPISAPWLKLAEAADYLNRVKPNVAVPIHDAFLSEPGRALTDQVMNTLSGDVQYRRLGKDESLSVS